MLVPIITAGVWLGALEARVDALERERHTHEAVYYGPHGSGD